MKVFKFVAYSALTIGMGLAIGTLLQFIWTMF